ncbi:MAG: peptidylprolyl isomerase [Bacteroidetes bacterium]|nr:peptidylprolyl isomerase [Bacteroidota bacterium]
MKLYKIIFVASSLLCGTITLCNAQPAVADKIVGIAGSKILLLSEVEQNYLEWIARGNYADEAMKCKIYNQLLLNKMMLHHAILDSVEVSEGQITDQLESRFRYFINQFGGEKELEKQYGKSIVELKEEFRPIVRDQIMIQQMQGKISKATSVSPQDVLNYYNAIPKDSLPLINSEIEFSQIVMMVSYSDAAKKDCIERLKGYRDRVINGEDFAALAVLYSEDLVSAKQSGELGFVNRGDLVPEFEATAFKLKPGEVSQIVESKFGYHLIQMIERKGDMFNARHILLRPKVGTEDNISVANKLDSIATLVKYDSLSFAQAASRFSDDSETRYNGGKMINPQTSSIRFEADQIEGSIFFQLDQLKPGEITKVLPYTNQEGNTGYRILQLNKRTSPHVTNLKDDYQRLSEAASNEKSEKAMMDWIKKKKASTYFRIDDQFAQCDNEYGWKE